MQYSYLAALFAAGAAATPLMTIQNRDVALSGGCESKLSTMGLTAMGTNAQDASSSVWIGEGGPYTSSFTNNSPHEICLVVWDDQAGYQSSFVGAVQPLITVSLPAHSHGTKLSFASGTSGAWAGVWPDTVMSQYGQIQDTWGEFTFSPSGVVDVSREVTMDGHHMRIKGPDCTSTMNKCVFQCTGGSTCGDAGSYTLVNCAAGSQAGAQSDEAAENGGCGWMGKEAADFFTTFH